MAERLAAFVEFVAFVAAAVVEVMLLYCSDSNSCCCYSSFRLDS